MKSFCGVAMLICRRNYTAKNDNMFIHLSITLMNGTTQPRMVEHAQQESCCTYYSSIDDATYIGHINIIDFNLGELTSNAKVGLISVEADVDGEGFTLIKMNTAVKGIISKYEYINNNITYV